MYSYIVGRHIIGLSYFMLRCCVCVVLLSCYVCWESLLEVRRYDNISILVQLGAVDSSSTVGTIVIQRGATLSLLFNGLAASMD